MQNGIKSTINTKRIYVIIIFLLFIMVLLLGAFIRNVNHNKKVTIESVINPDKTTTITCTTKNTDQEYIIYQLPMMDEAGGCCYAIESPENGLIMIDSGYQSDAAYIREFIMEHGGIVEAWFVTHPHFDHAGGLIQLLHEEQQSLIDKKDRTLTIKAIYYAPFTEDFFTKQEEGKDLEVLNASVLFQEFEALKAQESSDETWLDIDYIPVSLGQSLNIEGVVFSCLNGFDSQRYDVNANSLALRMDIRKSSFLFTGDITDQSIQDMKEKLPEDTELWDVDFIQIPHHGYMAGISGDTLYRLTTPQVAFLDCSLNEYETNAVNILEHVKWLDEMNIPVVKRFEGINQIVIK